MTNTSDTDVARHYNFMAEDYHRQYQRENLGTAGRSSANYFRLQILVSILARSGFKRVYEVGVGEGTPLLTLAKMGFDVAGCDIATQMVEKAKDTFNKNGLSPDLIQWGDVQDSITMAGQLKAGRFDAALAFGVLPHVKNDELFLDNIRMFTRVGGKVFIEFRNKLFSLFTFNRYTKEFILDDLLRDVAPSIKAEVAKDLDARLDLTQPPVRAEVGAGVPGYDAITSKFHNPFELVEKFRSKGYGNPRIHWYNYHPAPPMLEKVIGSDFRQQGMLLEHEGSWRGYFLCSAGVIEADVI